MDVHVFGAAPRAIKTSLKVTGAFAFVTGVTLLCSSGLLVDHLLYPMAANTSRLGETLPASLRMRLMLIAVVACLLGVVLLRWQNEIAQWLQRYVLTDSTCPPYERAAGYIFLGCTVVVLLIFVLDYVKRLAGWAWLFAEDGPSETATVFLYIFSSVLFVLVGRGMGHRRRVAAYALSALCLFIALEEISWGQRIVGWGTPTAWIEVNTQGETNLHNILNPYFHLIYGSLVLIPLVTLVLLRLNRSNASPWLPHASLLGGMIVLGIFSIPPFGPQQEAQEACLALLVFLYAFRLFAALRGGATTSSGFVPRSEM